MVTDVQKHFRLQIKLLRWGGISLKEKDSFVFHMYSFIIFGAILSSSIFGIQGIIAKRDRLDTLTENLVFGGSLLMAFAKIFTTFLLRRKLGKAMLLLQNGLFKPNVSRGGREEEKLINECMVYANAQGILLLVLSCLYLLSPNAGTAILRVSHSSNSSYWILPFGDVSFLNTTHSPVYEMVWAFQSVSNFMACIGYSSTSVFTATVMAFLSVQCKILQNVIKASVKRSYLEMVQQVPSKKDLSKVEWKYLQKSLKEIVEYHMAITDTTNEFGNLFSILSLLDFFGIATILCLAMFYAILVPGLNFRCLQMITLACGTIALQFMTAYWGNEVTLQYLAIGEACSEVDYVGTDIRFQKGLRYIIQRTQTPVQFTVGKFAPLTLNTFVTVLRAAYSCCMLLRNLGI